VISVTFFTIPLLNAQFYWRQSSSFFPCTWTFNFTSYVNLNLPKVELSMSITWLAYNVKDDSRYRVFRNESATLTEAATLTEVFPCFFLSCKTNARV